MKTTTEEHSVGEDNSPTTAPRDFEAEWSRDKHLIRARQELAEAIALINSAAIKLGKDKRTKMLDFLAVQKHLRRKEARVAKALIDSPDLYA